MNIALGITFIIILFIICFIFSKLKISFECNNIGDDINIWVKGYIFSNIRVFFLKNKIVQKNKTLKEKIEFFIDYFFKSKADPLEYAKKELKKSDKSPKLLKKIDIQKIKIEIFKLNLILDLGNAAVTAISTGAANAIIGMVLGKYADNIIGDVDYQILPQYNGNGIKLNCHIKASIKIIDVIKMVCKRK